VFLRLLFVSDIVDVGAKLSNVYVFVVTAVRLQLFNASQEIVLRVVVEEKD
jgi:hypothetical protein